MPDNIYDAIIGMANDIKSEAEVDVKKWCDYIVNYTEQAKKENAELRECLKKMMMVAENRMPKHPTFLEVEYINDTKAALEGGNHAND